MLLCQGWWRATCQRSRQPTSASDRWRTATRCWSRRPRDCESESENLTRVRRTSLSANRILYVNSRRLSSVSMTLEKVFVSLYITSTIVNIWQRYGQYTGTKWDVFWDTVYCIWYVDDSFCIWFFSVVSSLLHLWLWNAQNAQINHCLSFTSFLCLGLTAAIGQCRRPFVFMLTIHVFVYSYICPSVMFLKYLRFALVQLYQTSFSTAPLGNGELIVVKLWSVASSAVDLLERLRVLEIELACYQRSVVINLALVLIGWLHFLT